MEFFDAVVVGGGIVGAATLHALVADAAAPIAPSPLLLEAEPELATHQTGHNSGVIHSGLYYRPGSLKARNCTAGREALYRFCAREGLPHERCGKIVVATTERELPMLAELERRGRENGLRGLQRLDAQAIRRHEPAATGIAGLYVRETGIVDYPAVARRLAERAAERGATIRTGCRFRHVRRERDGLTLETDCGPVRTRLLIGCAGLHSDRLARACGVEPGVRIIPFRGEYYDILPRHHRLVRNLIYPVPDPALPFLGVHFTRMIAGGREAGPNAVLALAREGYRRLRIVPRDLRETLTYPGFWRMSARYWKVGLGEAYRSLSRDAFVRALQRLLPEIRGEHLAAGSAGVRAQAVDRAGRLLDDFHIVSAERMIHVLNAPSPAATAALAIGRRIARQAAEQLAARE